MRRLLLLILCLCSMWAAQAQVAYEWRYWFDQSPDYEYGSSTDGTLHLDVDVSGLSKTLHQIHIQVRDADGVFSEPVTRFFLVLDDTYGSNKLYYWFDQNSEALYAADLMQGLADLDVSDVSPGVHSINFFATNELCERSTPQHRYFVKMEETANKDAMTCLIQIDNTPFSVETVDMRAGSLTTFDLDVTSLTQGLHKMDVTIQTPSGALCAAYTKYFIRDYLSGEKGTLRCLYSFDNETEMHEATSSDGLYHLDLDVSHLKDGPHSIRWILADDEGVYSSDKKSWFVKEHQVDSLQWRYWFDEGDTTAIVSGVVSGTQMLDVLDLSVSQHTLNYQFLDNSGYISSPVSAEFAKETEASFDVIYIVDETEYERQTVFYKDKITALKDPVKEGYTFSGWSEMPETMPGNDVTVTGSFTINDYKLTYVLDGEEIYSAEVTYGDSIPAIDAPTKVGHTFSGWSEHPDSMPAHDVIVTGAFAINKYKLTYVVDGVTFSESEVLYDADITPLEEPTKEGYTFSGWSEIPETVPASDVTVTGSFTVNQYMLTYYVDGVAVDSFEVDYGTKITPKDEPTRIGESFSGWIGVPDVMPAHDVVVTGSFGTNFYHITYMVDGIVHDEGNVAYGSIVVPLSEPTKEGYTFSGWSEIPETMPANDVTVTGSFSVNKYKVTYYVDGVETSSFDYEFGAVVTPMDAPTKEGHTFSGWSEIPATMPSHDVTIVGTFEVDYLVPDEKGELTIDGTDGTLFFRLKNEEGVTSLRINGGIDSNDAKLIGTLQNLQVINWDNDQPMPSELLNGANKNLLIYLNDKASIEGATGEELPVNVVQNGRADKMVLADHAPLLIPEEFTAKDITFTRDFTRKTKVGSGAGWESLILPYDVEIAITEDGRYIAPFGSDAATYSNVTPFWLAQYTSDGFVSATEIKANVPYIISMPNSDEYDERYNVTGKVVFRGRNVSVHKTEDAESASSSKYTFIPTYESVEPAMNIYAINDEQLTIDGNEYAPGSVFVSNSGNVHPFEVYFSANSMSAAPRFIRIIGDDAVGIEGVYADKKYPASVFNLNGQKVNGSYKGIVIENGRKRMQ